MSTVLRIVVVLIPVATALALTGETSTHAATFVGLYLEPAPADPTYSGSVRLWCGWHAVCDGVSDPGYYALDFHTYNESDNYVGQVAFWRMKGYDADSTAVREVGRVYRTGSPNPNACDYAYAEMYKLDGSWIGHQIYVHVAAYSAYNRLIYGQKYTGYQNYSSWGTFASDYTGCQFTGPHVHQDNQLNLAVVIDYYNNGGYPDELGCDECATPKAIWGGDYQTFFHYYR